jgi:hypothetical protein
MSQLLQIFARQASEDPNGIYTFNGTNQYATMGTGWEPLGLPYSIEFKAITDDVGTAAYAVAKDTAEGVAVFLGGGTYIYDGITTPSTISATGGLVADTEYTYVVNANATETTLTVITEGIGTEVSKTVGQGELTTIGATGVPGTYWGGPIWGLRLVDDSPLQDRTVMVGDKTRYVELTNEIVLNASDGFEIEFDYVRFDYSASGTSLTIPLGDDAGAARIQIYDSAHASQPSTVQYRTTSSSRNWVGALADIAQGQHCNLKIVCSGPTGNSLELFVDEVSKGSISAPADPTFTINRLYRANAGSIVPAGANLGNVRFENTTTGDTWVYALEDETS